MSILSCNLYIQRYQITLPVQYWRTSPFCFLISSDWNFTRLEIQSAAWNSKTCKYYILFSVTYYVKAISQHACSIFIYMTKATNKLLLIIYSSIPKEDLCNAMVHLGISSSLSSTCAMNKDSVQIIDTANNEHFQMHDWNMYISFN